ncbi:MAG: outer membrane protein [Gemmatimonadales bacterium]
MKRKLTVAAALVLVSLAGASTAQAQARASFFLGGGATIPVGDLADAFGTGWNGLAGVNFALPGLPFGIRVDGMYSQNSADSGDAKLKILSGNADAVFAFGAPGAPIKPYILAGIGMANAKVGDGDGESNLAFNGGAGINFMLSSLTVFVEARYFNVNSDPSSSSYIPISAGVRIGGK